MSTLSYHFRAYDRFHCCSFGHRVMPSPGQRRFRVLLNR